MKYNYTFNDLKEAVQQSFSISEVCRKLNCVNIPYRVRRDIEKFNLDTSHFTGKLWSKGKQLAKEKSLQYGVSLSSQRAMYYLLPERGHRCEQCGLSTWLDAPIPLELHHIDGDSLNNCRSNLQLLCPNCHSMTDNFRGRNAGNTPRISDEQFVDVLRTSKNIRQALLTLGLSPRGDNYRRANELIIKYNISNLLIIEHQNRKLSE